MTLTEFLLARIAEDRTTALQAATSSPSLAGQLYPARAITALDAHRRIVELHHPSPEYDTQACGLCQWDVDCDSPVHDYQFEVGRRTEWPCETILALASVYAAHPDYRPEWRP